MRYTVQFWIAGYSAPAGADVEHHNNLRSIGAALQREHDQAGQYGAGYEPSECLVWRGEMDDTTDIYPDMHAQIGPRGGVQWDHHI